MKFFWKVFSIFTVLFAIVFSIFGTWIISETFKTSLNREIERGDIENKMFQFAFETTFKSFSDSVLSTKNSITKEVIQSITKNLEKNNSYYKVYNDQQSLIFSGAPIEIETDIIASLDDNNTCGYQIIEDNNHYYLIIICKANVKQNLYYLESMKDISYNSNIKEKLEVIMQAKSNGGSAIEIFSTGYKSFLIDAQLISNIQEELKQLFSLENLQNIAQYNLEEHFMNASYYNIISSLKEGSENNNVVVCRKSFSDFKTFRFSFLVDPQSYKIYGARIVCKEVEAYVNELLNNQVKMDQFNEVFRQTCQTYYEANTSSLYTNSQPNVVLKLTYDNFTVFPRRNLLIETPLGRGVEIGFIDLLDDLIY